MIGSTIGNYRIVERLGDGGMGSVFRAVDEMLDREVAIKVLRPELARQAALVERFRQEARALSRLSHPRIATLHGMERHGDELLMIMEFVRGDTLETVVHRSGRIAWQRAAELCIAVLDALDHAHDNQIVHRDIKPANIMLAHSGAVKVMDFGIARMLGRNRQTQFGHAVGTPTYMAPEQLRGEEVDRRTDIYAVGAVLFELVTGRLPFEAESDYRLMMMQLHDPPPRPSTMLPDVPGEVDDVIARAMAKSRDDRFPDAPSFARELQRIVDLRGTRRARTPAPETRLAAAPVAADAVETAPRPLAGGLSDTAQDAGATRVAGDGDSVGSVVPATRLGGLDAPETRLGDAMWGTPAQGADAMPGAPGAPRGAGFTVRQVLSSLEPWQKDWRTWTAVGALFVVGGLAAMTLRSPGSPDDGAGLDVAVVEEAAQVQPTEVAAVSDQSGTRGGGAAYEPPREDAASLIINRPVGPTPVAPPPENKGGSSGPARPDPGKGKAAPAEREEKDSRNEQPEPPGREEQPPQPVRPPRPEPEQPRAAGQSEAEARAEIEAVLSRAASQLSGRDGSIAESLLDGAVAGEWATLMREGRISLSLDGTPGVQLNGDRASVDIGGTVNVRSAFGANRRRPARFTAVLERSGGRWVLRRLQPSGGLDLK